MAGAIADALRNGENLCIEAPTGVGKTLLAKALGYTGICVSNPAAWIGADIFFVISYYAVMRSLRRRKGILQTKEEPIDGDHIMLDAQTLSLFGEKRAEISAPAGREKVA